MTKEQVENIEIKNCPIEIANDIWNAAIKIAALKAYDLICDSEEAIETANEIRKLKK